MKNISIRDFETDRLLIKKPTMEEQFSLWNILRDENVNRYYFPTPDRIFIKNNLSKDTVEDLKQARKIFMEQLNDWERQQPFYEKKIEAINEEDNSQKYTWSIFLKTGEPIGQITVQPKDEYADNPEQLLEAVELNRLVDRFLRQLPQKDCCVFLRRYWYMDSMEEIARRYHMPLGSVKSMLFRTRQKLRDYLEKEGVWQ